MVQDTPELKESRLESILQGMASCLVAFSGGVDSAYLAILAHRTLGERALAVTAESPSYPASQKTVAVDLVRRWELRHEFIHTEELTDSNYTANPVNRCYFCKHELHRKLQLLAEERGFAWVVDGNNLDDTMDHRPGRAAGARFRVRSPLIEAGMSKADIRLLSRRHGLPTWDQPASPCLASRIPYGFAVTREKLEMIERSEAFLRTLGFRQHRVRHHGDVARIEIARDELAAALDLAVFNRIAATLKEIGFRFVALDMEGYRTGALNEARSNDRASSRS